MTDAPGGGTPGGGDPGGDLTDADLSMLAGFGRANERTRSLLCTLARCGTWLRQTQPERSASLLGAIAPWPWYKAGQFVFDLFEWEDFMVDGPPPPLVAGDLAAATIGGVANLLRSAAAELDPRLSGLADPTPPVVGTEEPDLPEVLPPLEPGLHLYQDVALGLLLAASNSHRSSDPSPAPTLQDET